MKYLFPAISVLTGMALCAQAKTKREKALLQGSWFGKEYDEHAVFFALGDSIVYVEHFDTFKYEL